MRLADRIEPEPDPRRSSSRERVLRVLQRFGPVSRAEIAERAALSRATVSSVVAELRDAGLAVETEDAADGRRAHAGRPPGLIRLATAVGAAAGLDFGKRHLRVAVADLGRTVLAERRVELEAEHTADRSMVAAAELLDEVLAEAGVDRGKLVGVGMGVPGPIHQPTGELGSGTILPGWVGVRAQEAMAERLGLPVLVDNDANLGALGEWTWGAARACADVVYLKIATGIGAGLIVGGRPLLGAGGTAGEIGHTIMDREGPVCRCGNRGCLEMLVGVPALLDLLEPVIGRATLPDVLRLAREGNQACIRVIADAGAKIGEAAAILCNLVNPARIVVGWELGAAGDLLLDPMRDELHRAAIPSAAADVEVVAGTLGERAEVLGAIALALRAAGVAGLAAAA
jgi:predicted NBD/HSP70 family sugar kinase/biotin operon repressor